MIPPTSAVKVMQYNANQNLQLHGVSLFCVCFILVGVCVGVCVWGCELCGGWWCVCVCVGGCGGVGVGECVCVCLFLFDLFSFVLFYFW